MHSFTEQQDLKGLDTKLYLEKVEFSPNLSLRNVKDKSTVLGP